MNLSVVIPALNEEANIGRAIDAVLPLKPLEIIVVDGGSMDKTVPIARSKGARVISGERGRGKQLRKGVEEAKGDIILMLHADAVLPQDMEPKELSLPDGYVAGYFKLKFESQNLAVKLVEFFANLRSWIHALPYGDQAIFVKRETLLAIGGVRDYPFLEDLDLVLRLRKIGKLKRLKKSVLVSPRRLLKGRGLYPIFHSIKNAVIAILFMLGASPQRLQNFYR